MGGPVAGRAPFDGKELGAAFRSAERKRRLVAWGLVLPATLYLLGALILPIAAYLLRAVDNGDVVETLPTHSPRTFAPESARTSRCVSLVG